MIVWVSVVTRRTVCDGIDSHFDNLSRSHRKGQVNSESSVDVRSLVIVLIGRQSRELIDPSTQVVEMSVIVNVSQCQCHHKQSFSGLHSPGRS